MSFFPLKPTKLTRFKPHFADLKRIRLLEQLPVNSRLHASSSSPRKNRFWLRITIVTATAAVIGAYIRSQQNSPSRALNPFAFTQYELVSKTPVSPTSSIFSLRPVQAGLGHEVYLAA